MNTKTLKIVLVTAISLTIAVPAFARGGGFGGGGRSFGGGGFGGGGHSFGGGGFGGGGRSFGGGGFGGGGHSFGGGGGDRSFGGGADRSFGGGGDRSFGGGGDRSFGGGGDRSFGGGSSSGFGGRQSGRDFGGGFNSLGGGGDKSFGGGGFENRGGGGQGFENRGNFGQGNRPDQPISSHPNFPGSGGFNGISGLQNRTPHNISQNNLQNQGKNIRNSFNNNSINKNNQFNNTNNYNVNRYGGYGGYGNHGYGSGFAHGWADSNMYHGGYWGGAGCWGYPGWSEASMWTCMGISSLTTFLGMGLMGAEIAGAGGSNKNSAPASTTNVTYQGDTVYVNGQPYGSSQAYYQSAQQLAAQAYAQGQQDALASQNYNNSQYNANGNYPPLAPDVTSQANTSQSQDWAPLGVFALAEPGQTQSNMMLQIAINKQGTVRGNYLNQLTNERSQIYGALDKNTQRVSWTIGQNTATVFDTTIGDLTKEDSQIMVHYGPNNTQEMALIRLPAPPDSGANAGDGSSSSSSPTPGT